MAEYKNASCRQCGKHFALQKGQDKIFCFCSDECNEEYHAWLKKHEQKCRDGEFAKMSLLNVRHN